MCYTYDDLNRVTNRTIKNMSNVVLSEETFTYDAAGNVTSAPDSSFRYDINNRLISYNGSTLSYDADGNMLWGNRMGYAYDSANRLISAGGHAYTYNAEDVRIRNLCEDEDEDTIYTYNTNAKLSQLLMKTTNGAVTKYVYGRGLIGEETNNSFKTYHFDCRGSTIAITDASGNITDTFAYDTYGKLISRTGTGKVIFGYNGRDGVVTDENGLVYMRARYYSPDMRRFINADIVAGAISNAVTLNRFAYANGNPISFADPMGLRAVALSPDTEDNDSKQNSTFSSVKYPLNNSLLQHYSLGRTIRNPWRELSYPGMIHNAVVVHLAGKHKLVPEYVPPFNRANRYDLYAPATNQYWEVKPITYIADPDRAISMEMQMRRYDLDGAIRGIPLGNSEFLFGDYKIKTYSSDLGKVYYTFEREEKKKEQEQEEFVMIPEKEKSEETNPVLEKQQEFDWEPVVEKVVICGGLIIGTVAIIGGFLMLFIYGDSSGLNQGIEYWQRAIA